MKKAILLIFIIIQCSVSFAHSASTDSLLNVLDNILKNQKVYIDLKNEKINFLRNELANQTLPERKYEINNRIIEEYQYYISDSVLAYIEHNRILAEQTDNVDWKLENRLQLSYILSSTGLFSESKKILDAIPFSKLNRKLRLEYFKCCELYNVHMQEYINDNRFIGQYLKNAFMYRDSVLSYLTKGTPDYLFWSFKADIGTRPEDAKQDLIECLKAIKFGTHFYAGTSYCLALFYNEYNGGKEREEKLTLLINSAISDVMSVTKENMALMSLASFLFKVGDIQRAYKYTLYALDDANFYQARYRNFQIGQMMPIVEKAYQQRSDEQKKRLQLYLIGISLLTIVLIILTAFTRKQMNNLAKARQSLNRMNDDLQHMNNSLQVMNDNLNDVNRKLSESNEVKVEYIGRFLDLCSDYIDKLESNQKLVSRKIIAGQVDELYRMVSSPNVIEKEIKTLYEYFDNAFLQLYPDFVEQFNKLLREENHFKLRKNEKLNTELRTFALIRLGITDNAKIAAFLRCSIQTVYNYRCKKGKAVDETEDFEDQVRRIVS